MLGTYTLGDTPYRRRESASGSRRVLATLLDAAGGAACWSLLENESDRLSTVDLRIDYLRPGPAQAMICEAKVVRMGNKVCVARMEIFSEGDDPNEIGPIATGQGVYNVAKPKTRSNKV